MYAIKSNGIGKKVGARAIRRGWPLLGGETFTVRECKETYVLADDEISLREGTERELNPPDARTNAQKLEARTGLNVDDIKAVLGIV